MNVLSLFSGIGGIELGLEATGEFTCVGQVEIDPYCRVVLARHWPDVPRHDDVRTCPQWWYDGTRRPYVDVVCGGFPCQDISAAGKGEGIEGPRSGLWAAMAHTVRCLRPRYVIVENVPALRWRGLGRVLGDLATCGYDAEWDCIPASAIGANHRRDRLFVVAYPARAERRDTQPHDLASSRWPTPKPRKRDSGEGSIGDWWAVEPDVGRVAHGIPGRVDRLKALGNAVVPQVAEHIGRVVIDIDRRRE